jgi:uncharacterized protein YndB with AHSA1/START domain
MTEQSMTLSQVSTERMREATGWGWPEWLEALDAAGAGALDHGAIVRYLERAHPDTTTSWWRQCITVGYEQARGKRAVGQNPRSGFQVGVQRTVAATAQATWDIIVGKPELWLGEHVLFEAGERYKVDGASGEIRVVKPGDRLRLTWQPDGWVAPATVQLTLSEPASGKTALHVQLEKLPDADARETMRADWAAALDRIVAAG